MRRSLLLMGALSGCSLVYGLYDNQGPRDGNAPDTMLEAGVDAPVEAMPEAAAWNGCPDALSPMPTFCEYFDETPPWPDPSGGAQMTPFLAWSLSSASCNTPPHCAAFDDGADGGAQRVVATPSGLQTGVTIDYEVRADQTVSCNTAVGRTAWAELTTTAGLITIGGTHCTNATESFFLFWTWKTDVNAMWVGNGSTPLTVSLGAWYHLKLVIGFSGQVATLTDQNTANSAVQTFAQMGLPSTFTGASVTQVAIKVGGSASGAGVGDTVDTVVVDVN